MAWWLSESEGVSEAEACKSNNRYSRDQEIIVVRHFIVWLVNNLCLFISDHGTRRGYSDSRRYVESSVITSFYIHFTLHCQHNMTICGLSLHDGNTESRKNLEEKFTSQLGTLYPHGFNERLSFHYLVTNSCPTLSTFPFKRNHYLMRKEESWLYILVFP